MKINKTVLYEDLYKSALKAFEGDKVRAAEVAMGMVLDTSCYTFGMVPKRMGKDGYIWTRPSPMKR